MLEHGGRLRLAAKHSALPLNQWLDLSTGINPIAYPLSCPPAESWQRLPEPDDGLITAACQYYGCQSVLPTAGSQAAIQLLPQLRNRCRVGILHPSYNEHAHAWCCAGHDVVSLSPDLIESELACLDVMVLVNPNNPTGIRFEPERLLKWHQQLAERDGWLIVDEAFMDATPQSSVIEHTDRPGLIVLRSLGKFFGLAGARVGFVAAAAELLLFLEQQLGPWSVTGPSRWVAGEALRDRPWQLRMQAQLFEEAQKLSDVLSRVGLAPSGGTALFQSIETEHAPRLSAALAEQGVLVRQFQTPASLRFGLPSSDQWPLFERRLLKAQSQW